MRPLIIKDKYIGKSKIESFKDFSLEDNYLIKEKEDGFFVEGKVILRGNLNYESEVEELYKEIDINILIPFEKLESRNMIKLVLDKADFDKNDNVLIIKLRIKVVGEDELKEKLIIGRERKMEFPPKDEEVSEEVKLDDDFLKSMEEMIKGSGKEIEVVSTMEGNETDDNDIFEVRVDEDELAIEDKGIVEDSIVPLPLIKEDLPVSELPIEEKKDEQKKEELLKTEYVKTFFFHRVKKDENINDILSKYNMNYEDFKKLNKKTDIKENDLIQIKIK